MAGLTRIALIADIHGNLPALEAVLTDIRRRGISRVFCLGDLVGKGGTSDRVVDVCRAACEVNLLGNWDENIARSDETGPALAWYRAQLGPERLAWLTALPAALDLTLSGRHVRLFHASPHSVHVRVHQDARDKHPAMFENTSFTGAGPLPDVVGYADIHDCFMTWVGDKLLFNTGSVGNPLESPHASYAVLEGEDGDDDAIAPFNVSFARVSYDVERAVADAKAADAPWADDFAHELRTAQYLPRSGRPAWPDRKES
jgi:predicted phosphodiesterase